LRPNSRIKKHHNGFTQLLAATLLMMCCAQEMKAQNADIRLLRQTNLHRMEQLDKPMQHISNSSAPASVIIPAGFAISSLINSNVPVRNKTFYLVECIAVSAAVSLSLKYAVNRPRPYVKYPELENFAVKTTPSFPSGHTSNAFALATSMTLAFPRWYVAAPALIWAGAVGYSRMHLGVHYPSDVAMGALVGSGSAFLCAWLNHMVLKQPYPWKTSSTKLD